MVLIHLGFYICQILDQKLLKFIVLRDCWRKISEFMCQLHVCSHDGEFSLGAIKPRVWQAGKFKKAYRAVMVSPAVTLLLRQSDFSMSLWQLSQRVVECQGKMQRVEML